MKSSRTYWGFSWLFFFEDMKWFVCVHLCVRVHARACVRAKTTRRGSRRNGPCCLFIQLSGRAFAAVGVAFPLVLSLAGSHPRWTKAFLCCLALERICHDLVSPGGPSSRAWVPSDARERRIETGECPCPILTPYSWM